MLMPTLKSELKGQRVLVVEDEFMLAQGMADAILEAGGVVLGPVADVASAMALLAGIDPPDAAILDIRLGEEQSFPVVTLLHERGIPLLMVSGYDDWFLPSELDDVVVYQKPMDAENVVRLLIRQTSQKPGELGSSYSQD